MVTIETRVAAFKTRNAPELESARLALSSSSAKQL